MNDKPSFYQGEERRRNTDERLLVLEIKLEEMANNQRIMIDKMEAMGSEISRYKSFYAGIAFVVVILYNTYQFFKR